MFRTFPLALEKCFIPNFSGIAQNVSYPFLPFFVCKCFIPPKIDTVKRLTRESEYCATSKQLPTLVAEIS